MTIFSPCLICEYSSHIFKNRNILKLRPKNIFIFIIVNINAECYNRNMKEIPEKYRKVKVMLKRELNIQYLTFKEVVQLFKEIITNKEK